MMIEILIPFLILAVMGLLFGIGIGLVSKKFSVPQDPKFPLIRDALPGANCGGCGYAGCDAYAKAVVSGEAPINACAVGGEAASQKMAEVLGVKVQAVEKEVAYVQCSGECGVVHEKMRYDGVASCLEASLVPGGGPKSCSYGCLGFGTCVKVCKFNAIHVENGLAKVDESKCVGCGACVSVCPKNVIRLVAKRQRIRVQCSGQDRGKEVWDARSVYGNVNPAPSRWLAMWLGSIPTNVHNAENALKNVLPKSFIFCDGLAAASGIETAALF